MPSKTPLSDRGGSQRLVLLKQGRRPLPPLRRAASNFVEGEDSGSYGGWAKGWGVVLPLFPCPMKKGNVVKFSELRKGEKIVLFFYPKDDTPGCTKEACSFRDGLQAIRKKGAVVLGVSADSVASHQKFSQKFDFNFPLLSDESKSMIQAYGVWKEKSMYGRKYMGIERTTVLIAKDGSISRVFPKVKVEGHYEEVLDALG